MAWSCCVAEPLKGFGKTLTHRRAGDVPPGVEELVADEGDRRQPPTVSRRLDALVTSPVSNGLTGDEERDGRLVDLWHLSSQMEGYWRLMPNGSPVGMLRGGCMAPALGF